MIKAIIFDIDGILIDSEPLHAEALVESLKIIADKSIEFQPEDLIGLSLDETLDTLGIHKDRTHELKKIMVNYYLEHLHKSMLRPGIQELWRNLVTQDIPFGCVSSSEMKICTGNIKMIDLPVHKKIPVISCECVSHTKPHPMPYIKMMERLGLAVDEVVVLEDSDVGITSAKAAGIENIYAWPHGLSKSQSYKDVKEVISNIHEVPFIRNILMPAKTPIPFETL
ncbi:MAG TPA: HAD family phosphatase [Clostridia bacterium]